MTSDGDSEENEIEGRSDFGGQCCGQRHGLALLCCWLLTIAFCLRVNLNVALVAMVNNTAVLNSSKGNIARGEECPVSKTNGSSARLRADGSFMWSRDLQGLILGAFFWGYIILQLPGGTLSQRFGGKWILTSAMMGNVILTILTPLAASFSPYLLIAVRVAEGAFQSVLIPATQAMFGRWVPPKEASFLCTLGHSGCIIGVVVGQIVSGQLCQSSWGWPSAFYVNAGIAAVGLVPWLLFAYNSPEENPWISANELSYISRHLGTGSQEMSNRIGVPWLRIVTDIAVWGNIVGRVCICWTFDAMVNCLPQYLSDVLHFDISADGILSSFPGIFNLFLCLVTGWLTDLMITRSCVRPIVARKVLYFGGCLGAVGCMCGIIFFGCNAIASVAFLMILMGCNGIAGIHINANVAELSPEFSGTIMGIANTFSTLPGIVAPIVIDDLTVNGRKSEWSKVFYIGSGITMFGGIFFVIFASSKARKWNVLDEQKVLINDDGDK